MSDDSKKPEEQVFISYFIQSGWMPPAGSGGHRKFIKKLKEKDPKELDPKIKDLKDYIEGDPTVKWMLDEAFRQNGVILRSPDTLNNEYQTGITIPDIPDLETLLNLFNQIMDEIPQYADGDLIGLPFSAVTVGIDPTLEGAAVFRLPEFNEFMKHILNKWNTFLGSPESVSDGKFVKAGWLKPEAKISYDFPIW
ncbi:MAG: phophatidylserine decarboxylase associated domain-containing protein [Bacteroidota bacterium]